MSLPDALFHKQTGQTVKSDDWNTGFSEVNRLDTAKVNRVGGDTITGPLTVGGLTVSAKPIVAPNGSLSLAMLGMLPIQVDDFAMVVNSAVRITVERYPADVIPAPAIPAFIQVVSSTPPATIRIEYEDVEHVLDTSVNPPVPYITRTLSLVQTSVVEAVVRLNVVSSVPVEVFRPSVIELDG